MNSTIAFWILGVLCVVAFALYLKKGIRYKKCCTERVDAVIFRIERHHSDKKREYMPWYTYRVNGVDYKVRGSSTSSTRKYHEGDESFVVYNPENPQECMIEGKNAELKTSAIFAFLAILFITFALFVK